MPHVLGLHHITAIAGPAQENLDFYAGVLGMRLVKKSVNQDDPGTYHLFYADAEGSPGTDLTFFPWAHLPPGRLGHGLATEVALEVPRGSLGWWATRLEKYGTRLEAATERFGEKNLPLIDPHGMKLVLVEAADPARRQSTPWSGSAVPGEYQIRGLHGAHVWVQDATATENFLTGSLGLKRLATQNGWTRFGSADGPGVIDVRSTPTLPRGMWGVGTVHHLAWRVRDEAHELAVREKVAAAGRSPTEVIDRFWFKSVYFKEPGGVLFELATDGPGFAVDEDPAHLGESLVLPPFLQPHRAEIEKALPPLRAPR